MYYVATCSYLIEIVVDTCDSSILYLEGEHLKGQLQFNDP